ncbi:hypothetical protein L3X38_009766 [Prunus dulcis]|uniref:Uncharacterized protein n=1 Tax=Prunus dulcis TaxID=3755 RepID=A0AAD4WF01_PRUDU|nr:hypothetical protein L3X38_009766 [Prunus dulcis]
MATENNTTAGKSNWSWVVVCERQVLHQSWSDIRTALTSCLDKDVELFPYQINRAFFVCESKTKAMRVSSTGPPLPGFLSLKYRAAGNHWTQAAAMVQCALSIQGISPRGWGNRAITQRRGASKAPQREPTTELRHFPEGFVKKSNRVAVKKSWGIC